MPRSMRTIALTIIAAGLAACAPAAATFGDADANAIRQLVKDYTTSQLAGQWDTWTGLFTDDVAFLPPNAPIVSGKAAVRAFGEAFPKVTTFTAEAVDIAGRGDLAYARGTYALTANPAGAQPIQDKGKWLAIYRKQADGSWKVIYNAWNSDLPLPAAAPAPAK